MAPHWHILGAGAIGSLFASQLHQSGCAVTLLSRQEQRDPVVLTIEQGDVRQNLSLARMGPAATGYISHLLVTTKAYDARTALAGVAHCLDEQSHIVLLVNGMGVLEELLADHPHLNFYAGTTTEGAYRAANGNIVHAGTGVTRLGHCASQPSPAWFQDWVAMSTHCVWDEDILTALWQKLAVNSAINPLTAIHRCNNGELLTTPAVADELRELCGEIARIAEAAGQGEIASNLQQTVEDVARDTSKNRSSMLQDVLAQRRTEIEHINGFLANTAKRLQIPAPLNTHYLNAVRNLEAAGNQS